MVADEGEPNAFLHEPRELAIEVEAHQPLEVGNLLLTPPPILGREGVEREHLDAVIDGRLHRTPHGLGSGLVPSHARKAAPFGPAAVAIHDDRDVTRTRAASGLSARALG